MTLAQIVEELSHLSVLELSQLSKLLQETWGVTPSQGIVMAAGAAGAAQGQVEEESTHFQVMLSEVPSDKKLGAIKILREILGLGLKEAKEMVDKVAEGAQLVKDNVEKTEAEQIKKKIEEAGSKASLKGV